MIKELPKVYEPSESEDKIYRFWLDNGLFNAEPSPDKKPYSIVIPPPNVTGQLHMGHALDDTLQDILIRTKRMQGYSTLWMPGTDHAGIATQIKVEAELRKEGKTRYDLGREEFLKLVWAWKEKYGSRIIHQLYKLGASCDWRRLRFTMDEGLSKAVRETFVSLYEKGLIYKGNRIINRCPNCETALSDAEVEYNEQAGKLWYIKYQIEGTDDWIEIATTRPETMMGDTGIAVNPEDERFKHLIGKNAILPLMNRPIPIFADEYVEKDFGTGCVKVTPCHDPNDFEMGLRHNLEFILIMDDKGRINENGGKYCGLDRMEARKQVVEDLDKLGLLTKIEDYSHNVGTCYRCGTNVEPITSSQWFVKMEPLAKEDLSQIQKGTVKFIPERFTKTYTNWMENVHDWCISRQLWWGHRIPAWYCEDCSHITVSRKDPDCCEKCGSKRINQDEDVLDTWFSSALWPFSTMGWPEKTKELEYYYPTNVLVTGYDIIFFWVARMICFGFEQMKERPFKEVFLHGIVRDSQGRKMSKSLGNGIDPIDVIDKYGADALRFTLVTGNSPGNDTRFYYERVEANRNFCNKIWNASRFVMMNLTVEDFKLPEKLSIEDKWILTLYNRLVREVTENIEKYELGVAADKLYSFIWDKYCDWYIELCKTRLNDSQDKEANECAQRVLGHVLTGTLKLLHPFMPFITESIWQALPHEGVSIMVSDWEKTDDRYIFPDAVAQMEQIMEAVKTIRNRRSEMNVPPSRRAALTIVTDSPELFSSAEPFLKRLAGASTVTVSDKTPENADSMVSCATNAAHIFMPLNELVDVEKERERIKGEIAKSEKFAAAIEGKLSNQNFVSRAPEAVVNAEREKLEKTKALIEKLKNSLKLI